MTVMCSLPRPFQIHLPRFGPAFCLAYRNSPPPALTIKVKLTRRRVPFDLTVNVGAVGSTVPAVPSAIVVASGVIDDGVGGVVDSLQAVRNAAANTARARSLGEKNEDVIGAVGLR